MSTNIVAPIVLIASIFLLLIAQTNGVDHDVFKTCEQSSFCRRSRSLKPGTSGYQVVANTLATLEDGITLDLINAANQKSFQLTLTALQSSTFRVQIEEKAPLKARYRISDALKAEPIRMRITSVTESSGTVTVVVGLNRAVITTSPFRIDFYQNNVLSLRANARGLMRFEHYRVKPTTPGNTIEDTDPGSWTETFQTWTDSKPMGPEAIALDFSFPEAKVLFGIPLHADSLSLKDTSAGDPYRLYNLDVAFHEVNSRMALYGAVPVLYGHGARRTSGVFWHNAAETWVDIYNASSAYALGTNFMSESGVIDAFVLLGPTPKDVFAQYTHLTGVTPLPQLYTLGYHQCRWNYDNQTDVLDVAANFDNYGIPLDTMWLDIEYTDSKKYFTWDLVNFPTPLAMIGNLSASQRHLTLIVDIHLKSDSTYSVNTDCIAKNLYTKTVAGTNFVGECWPGASSYPDVFMPAARTYLSSRYATANFPYTTEDVMIWNDMNEPSVFDGPEKTMPKDNLHMGTIEHRHLHNQFGHMQLRSTYQGLGERSQWTQRPFLLTRSHFAGSQRYAMIWTGDNTAEFTYLQASIQMCLAEAVAGFSFCGADVGGFFGHPTAELFERWFQAAAFTPFYRSHANQESPRREPWLFPNATLQRVRNAVLKRYTYLPLWYTMFYEHERFGLPVMRPLLTQYPADEAVFGIEDAFMLSDVLMVSPVMVAGALNKNVYFPQDLWYDVDDYRMVNTSGYQQVAADGDKTPVYQRGGTILPRRMIARRASAYMANDPYTLIVCLDQSNSAAGTLYIDDGKSYNYTMGRYIYTRFEYRNGVLSSRFVDRNDGYATLTTVERVLIVGSTELTSATITIDSPQTKDFAVTKEGDAYVLVHPNVSLAMEWSIQFNGGASAFGSFMLWPLVAAVVMQYVFG